jgi:hypothetical protein
MTRCIGWGPKTTWNGSHIHIQCVLDNSYVVDGQMDPPSFHCHQTCWCRVWGVDQFPGLQWVYKWCQGALVEAPKPQWFPHYSIHMERVVGHLFRADTGQMDPPSFNYHHTCWPRVWGVFGWCLGKREATNDVSVDWLRPQTHMEWLLHPLQTYKMCLRTFICCVYGQMDPPSLHYHHTCWPKVWGVSWFPWTQWGYKWCHGALVEAPDPHGMVPTSTPYICKVWQGVWELKTFIWCRWAVGSTIIIPLPPFLLAQNFQIRGISYVTARLLEMTNDVMVHWLRPQTHMERFPHRFFNKYYFIATS